VQADEASIVMPVVFAEASEVILSSQSRKPSNVLSQAEAKGSQ
jgi:hypothetical protein